MKVILTGATGFIGAAVLKQCIAAPSISSILVLTRRDLPKDSLSPKVKVILHDNFLEWPDAVLEQLQGAEGCIWCVGGRATSFPDVATARKVSVDFTLAAARKFSAGLAAQLGDGRIFNFVFCSGWGAEIDQDKKLWVMSDTRRIKGDVERGLFETADANTPVFAAYTLRPGGVLLEYGGVIDTLTGALVASVKVNVLALALIDVCENGSKDRVVENEEPAGSGGIIAVDDWQIAMEEVDGDLLHKHIPYIVVTGFYALESWEADPEIGLSSHVS